MRRISGAILIAFFFGTACNGGDNSGVPAAPIVKDRTAPTFGGATDASLLSDGNVRVSWKPAKDDTSPEARIIYRVFAGLEGETIDFDKPVAISPSGANRTTVIGLPQGVELSLVVRAMDEAGNEDKNKETVQVRLPDVVAPLFGGAKELVGISKSSAEVRWLPATDTASDVSYRVYFSADADPTSATPVEVDGSENSRLFGKLKESTRYYAHVKAVDSEGNEDPNSRVVSGVTLDESAPIFAGLESAVSGGTAVLLSWTPGADVNDITPPEDLSYRIFMATSVDGFDFSEPLTTVPGTSTSYTVKELTPDTTYYFLVRAVDASGNEEDNEVSHSATTASAADTLPPTFAGASSATPLSARSIRLSWSAASDDTTPTGSLVYDVWMSTFSGQPLSEQPFMTSTPGATSVDIEGLVPKTQYYFKVKARDIAGNRDDNQVEVSAKTKNDDTPPVFAGASAVIGTSATSVRVEWAAATDDSYPANEIYYDVYLATESGGENFAVPTKTEQGQTSTVISGLTRDTAYFAVVRARDPDGNVDENTTEASGSTNEDTTAPVLSSMPSTSAVSQTQIKVTWPAATDDSYAAAELSYSVRYGTTNGGPYTGTVNVAAGQARDVTISGLAVNTTYYVVVIPRDPSGNIGNASPQASVKTSSDATPPSAIGSVSLSGTSNILYNTLTLSWPAATDDFTSQANLRYEVCFSSSNTACSAANFTANVTTAASVTSAVIGSLPLGTKYYFAVRAMDEAGNRGTPSAVTTDNTAPAVPSNFVVSQSAANHAVNLSWSLTTDNVFNTVRYRTYYWDWCSGGGVLTAWTSPTFGATSANNVPGFYGASWAYVEAIDGFGNVSSRANGNVSLPVSKTLQPQWDASCGACHNSGAPYGYPWWTPTTAKQSPSPVNGLTPGAVVPSNTAASRMYQRVSAGTMPPGGVVDTALLCNLGRWINAGAP